MFLTFKARKVFIKLKQAFIETSILNHFDPEHHIQIETDASGYAIVEILSQLTLDDLGWWYQVAFFSKKMILAKTWYETYDGELLVIVEAFKTWNHYFKGCKYEVLVLTDHNHLQCFMNTKSLSFKYVWWARELSRDHFQIDYQQGKANKAADTFSWYPRRNAEEEKTFWAENTKILNRLQSLLV